MLLLLASLIPWAHAQPDPTAEGPGRGQDPAAAPGEGREPAAPAPAPAAPAPAPVVAIGDGLVGGHPPAEDPAVDPSVSTSSVAGGWVPVLADCLEERAPQRFTVVDRAVAAETLATARERVASVRELSPAFVLVTLGGAELALDTVDLKRLKGELGTLVSELVGKGRRATRPQVLLLSAVPPTLSQIDGSDPALQTALDARIGSWNDVLADLAKGQDGVDLVNLLADWPKDVAARASLTDRWPLSDQGHARVAAAVCDAIIDASGSK